MKRIATNYTITNRRLNIKRGIVSRTIQETRLERVQNVNYSQSVVQRMLQIGNVDFDTAAGDDYTFIFEGVAEPAEVVERVDQATRSLGAPGGLGDEEHGRSHRPGLSRHPASAESAGNDQRGDRPPTPTFALEHRIGTQTGNSSAIRNWTSTALEVGHPVRASSLRQAPVSPAGLRCPRPRAARRRGRSAPR